MSARDTSTRFMFESPTIDQAVLGEMNECSIMIFIGSWSSNGRVRVKSWGDTP